MKKIFLFCLLIMLFVPKTFADDLNTCNNHYKNQQFAKAANCYAIFVNKDPNVPELRMLYTLSLYNNKNYSSAIKQCKIIKQYYPNTKVSYMADDIGKKAQQRIKEITNAKYYDNGDYFSKISYSKWSTIPIRYWIQNGAYSDTVNTSFLEWEHYLTPTVRFTKTPDEKVADIKVYFSKNLPCKGENAVGCTSLTKVGTKNTDAKIYINPTFNTNVNQGAIKVMHVTMHEIGHALGVGGHSDNRNDVMYPSTDTNKNAKLSNRDIETIKHIYKYAK